MACEKTEPGTKITQPTPDLIRVVEGGLTSRVLGVLVCGGGVLLLSSTGFRFFDPTGLLGVALALFGAAVATQRFTTTLDRQRGTWTSGGDIFYSIRLHDRGLLSAVGPVRIGRREVDPSEWRRTTPVITYPITVEATKEDGGTLELRLGRFWGSPQEAREVAGPLAEFLGREVQDDSGPVG
jgi:hypothetical protein